MNSHIFFFYYFKFSRAFKMASLHDCYPDWETFESSALLKKKKKKNNKKNSNNANNFMNYEGFYPLEGFTNQLQEVEPKQNKVASNSLNITYGAPSEYITSEYNQNTYEQNPPPRNNNKSKNSNNRSSNQVVEVKNEPMESQKDDLKNEMETIRSLLNDIVERLDKKQENDTVATETTPHDMVLFVIFGLFVIFALEGTAKIIANLAKKGKF